MQLQEHATPEQRIILDQLEQMNARLARVEEAAPTASADKPTAVWRSSPVNLLTPPGEVRRLLHIGTGQYAEKTKMRLLIDMKQELKGTGLVCSHDEHGIVVSGDPDRWSPDSVVSRIKHFLPKSVYVSIP